MKKLELLDVFMKGERRGDNFPDVRRQVCGLLRGMVFMIDFYLSFVR